MMIGKRLLLIALVHGLCMPVAYAAQDLSSGTRDDVSLIAALKDALKRGWGGAAIPCEHNDRVRDAVRRCLPPVPHAGVRLSQFLMEWYKRNPRILPAKSAAASFSERFFQRCRHSVDRGRFFKVPVGEGVRISIAQPICTQMHENITYDSPIPEYGMDKSGNVRESAQSYPRNDLDEEGSAGTQVLPSVCLPEVTFYFYVDMDAAFKNCNAALVEKAVACKFGDEAMGASNQRCGASIVEKAVACKLVYYEPIGIPQDEKHNVPYVASQKGSTCVQESSSLAQNMTAKEWVCELGDELLGQQGLSNKVLQLSTVVPFTVDLPMIKTLDGCESEVSPISAMPEAELALRKADLEREKPANMQPSPLSTVTLYVDEYVPFKQRHSQALPSSAPEDSVPEDWARENGGDDFFVNDLGRLECYLERAIDDSRLSIGEKRRIPALLERFIVAARGLPAPAKTTKN